MRIGLIADIHGNLAALDAVLAELDADRVDEIVYLGDLSVLGPQPDEVISLIRERDIATVCGNTDAWLVPGHPVPAAPPDSSQSIHLTRWAAGRISDENRSFLRDLPMTLAVGDALLCFHGSPASVDDIMVDSIDRVGDSPAKFLAGGHTHIQEVRRCSDRVYLNPGSVGLPGVGPGDPGLPVNRDVAWAEYVVLDDLDGRTEVSLRHIPVDVELMWAEVQRVKMPHADWWRSRWAA